jgi:hypothetical protein
MRNHNLSVTGVDARTSHAPAASFAKMSGCHDLWYVLYPDRLPRFHLGMANGNHIWLRTTQTLQNEKLSFFIP